MCMCVCWDVWDVKSSCAHNWSIRLESKHFIQTGSGNHICMSSGTNACKTRLHVLLTYASVSCKSEHILAVLEIKNPEENCYKLHVSLSQLRKCDGVCVTLLRNSKRDICKMRPLHSLSLMVRRNNVKKISSVLYLSYGTSCKVALVWRITLALLVGMYPQ